MTVHLTLRRLQALHATAARLKVRTAAAEGGEEPMVAATTGESLCCRDMLCTLLAAFAGVKGVE